MPGQRPQIGRRAGDGQVFKFGIDREFFELRGSVGTVELVDAVRGSYIQHIPILQIPPEVGEAARRIVIVVLVHVRQVVVRRLNAALALIIRQQRAAMNLRVIMITSNLDKAHLMLFYYCDFSYIGGIIHLKFQEVHSSWH